MSTASQFSQLALKTLTKENYDDFPCLFISEGVILFIDLDMEGSNL